MNNEAMANGLLHASDTRVIQLGRGILPTVGDLLNVGPARANRTPRPEDAAPTLFEVP